MIATANGACMDEQRKYAEGFPDVGGMMHVVAVTLLPAMTIFRFASAGTPVDALYAAHWWIGVSPCEALRATARHERRSLSDVAREQLAVPPEWGNAMDLLVSARVRQPLAAWSGTPRTARSKQAGTQQYGSPWTPERSITQLYVPGLRETRPDRTRGSCVKWQDVLAPLASVPAS